MLCVFVVLFLPCRYVVGSACRGEGARAGGGPRPGASRVRRLRELQRSSEVSRQNLCAQRDGEWTFCLAEVVLAVSDTTLNVFD